MKKQSTPIMQRRRNKRPNPYKEANEAFLQVKAQEEGIVALDNGVLYRVLEEGHGSMKPTPRDKEGVLLRIADHCPVPGRML